MICKFLNLQHYSCPLQKEIFKRVLASYSHWNLTTAYFVAGHEQKYHYHYACHCYHWEQPNFRHINIYRSLLNKRSWRIYVTAWGITSAQLMYLKIWYSVFKVQKELTFTLYTLHVYSCFGEKYFFIFLNTFSLLYLNFPLSIPSSLHIPLSLLFYSIAFFTILSTSFSSSFKFLIASCKIKHSIFSRALSSTFSSISAIKSFKEPSLLTK